MMDFSTLSAARYSVRKFKDAPVPGEKIDLILEAARNAPTASNSQPQRILVITEEEKLRKVDAVTTCRFGAPVVFLICADTESCWVRPFDGKKSAEIDASIVTTQMMLQAADIGLGTTWVMYFDAAKARREFNIPDQWQLVAFLVLGFPADDAEPAGFHTQRLPPARTVFYEEL
jgi:nitroreductase